MDKAGAFFMVMVQEESGQVVGFVNGTLSTSEELTHDSMSTHEPEVGPVYREGACLFVLVSGWW